MQQYMAQHAVKIPRYITSNFSHDQTWMSLDLSPPSSHSFELHSLCKLLHTSALEPLVEILALTDIKRFKLVASINDGLNANPSDSNTSSDRQLAQFEKMKADAAE